METSLQKPWTRVQTQAKMIVFVLLMSIYLVSVAKAISLGPTEMDITVEKGKETEIVKHIQVLNSATNPVHITGSVVGPISEFITLEPKEFDLPAGPGAHSKLARPYQYVKVIFRIPRELPETKYTGQILFTEQPTTGGVLGTAVQLGTSITLNIGEMAMAEFPNYVYAMIIVLVVLLILSIVFRRKMIKKLFYGIWIYSILCLILVLAYNSYTDIFEPKISGYNLSLWSALTVNMVLFFSSIFSLKESRLQSILGIILSPLSTYLFFKSWTDLIYEYLAGFIAIPIVLLLIVTIEKYKQK